MSLAISQQFNRFVEFASGENGHGMDSIARAGDIAAGGMFAGRAIKEAEGDSLRKLRRSDDLQRENDMARKLFRQAVVEIFGGESRIPKSVKDAMKLKDYDQGKPLTARRILAVKAAIDVYAERAAAALDRAKAAATQALFYGSANDPVSPEKRAKIDRVLTVAVNAAVTDTDALEVVIACGKSIVETGDRNLRTEDAIKNRVAKLLGNVAELRAVAKGNQKVFSAGIAFLKDMRGKPVPDGMIKTLVETSMKQSIGEIKALNADSSGMKLHKAVVQMYKNVEKAMEAADSFRVTGREGEIKVVFRDFCVLLMLGRIGDEALPGIKTLLEHKGAVLNTFYGDIAGNFHFNGVDPAIREYMALPARNCTDIIEKIYMQLQVRQGIGEGEIHQLPFVRNANYMRPNRPNYVDIDMGDVAESIRDRAEEYAQQDRDDCLKNRVAGNGRGASKVRAVFDRALPPTVFDPIDKFQKATNKTIRGLINQMVCYARYSHVDNDYHDSRFNYPFLNGIFSVELPGVGVLARNNIEDAYNKLASFVTRGAKNTAAELDEREKKKLLTLLAFLNESTHGFAEKGAKLALDPSGRDDGKFATEKRNARCKFSLSFEQDNSLVIKYEQEYDLASLSIKNGQGAMDNVPVKAGSKLNAGYEVRLPAAEFERFVDLDFSTYDDDAVEEWIADPTVEKPYQNIKPTLGEGFGFSNSVEVSSSFKITVN